jgi:Fe2+ transport system protein B
MEETERGNQGVKDLIELHQKMETEYKDMTITYEKQHDEYKQSLQDRDDKLRILETQVKNQINSIEGKLTNVQNKEIDVNNQRMSRINELAQPRFITPKK